MENWWKPILNAIQLRSREFDCAPGLTPPPPKGASKVVKHRLRCGGAEDIPAPISPEFCSKAPPPQRSLMHCFLAVENSFLQKFIQTPIPHFHLRHSTSSFGVRSPVRQAQRSFRGPNNFYLSNSTSTFDVCSGEAQRTPGQVLLFPRPCPRADSSSRDGLIIFISDLFHPSQGYRSGK
jgi:hypothetical protein